MLKNLDVSWPADFGLAGAGRGDASPEEVGKLVGEYLLDRHREIFAVLDLPIEEVARRIFAWARINAPEQPVEDIRLLMGWADCALFELIERGVVKFVLHTPEADANLEVLRSNVTSAGLRPTPTVAKAAELPQPIAVSPIDQCAADYRQLHSSDFRSKWMSRDTRAIFDRAVSEGKI